MHTQRQPNNLINILHESAFRVAYNDYTSTLNTLLEKNGSLASEISLNQ